MDGGSAISADAVVALSQAIDAAQGQAPQDAAFDHLLPVEGEVDAGGLVQRGQDGREPLFVAAARRWVRGRGIRHIGMPANPRQPRRDTLGRQDEIHAAGGRGRLRHRVEFGGGPILRECHPARGLDGFQAGRAVRSRAGEDHADGLASTLFGQRPEEPVDGQVQPRRLVAGGQFQFAVRNGQIGFRRDDVYVVGFHRQAVGRHADRHGGRSRQNFGQHAVVLRIEMLNEYESQAGVGGQIGEQMLKSLQAARGGANANYRNG